MLPISSDALLIIAFPWRFLSVEPISMKMNMSHFQRWRMVRSLFLLSVGSALLASCSNLGYSSGSDAESQNSYTSDPEALAAEFNFPLTSCGEQATEPSGTWYVVYIDGANPDEVRREYCRDAIGTVRDDTGAPTVQVASLTDYSKALKLATAVGGEVETTVVDRTSPSPTGANSGTNAQANPSATSTDMASLTATDPGSLINVRERASTSSGIRHTGRSGERVRIAEQQQGDDGRTWYKVVLETGTEGWVRSDFVSRQTASNDTTGSTSNGGTSGTTGSFNSNTNQPTPSTSVGSSGTSSDLRYPTDANSNGSNTSSSSSPADSYPSSSSTDGTNRYASSDRSTAPSSQTASDSYSTGAEANPNRFSSAEEDADVAYDDTSGEETSGNESIDAGGYATLRSENPGARINVRGDASTTADIQDVGFAGDSVQVIDTIEGEDGYIWYQVELETGAVGWVRGDLLNGV
jgi:uncharacterized protein YgiM (DUF1202 family)